MSDFAKKKAAAANQLSASTGNLTDAPSYAALRQMKSRLGASNRRDPDLKIDFVKYINEMKESCLTGDDEIDNKLGKKFVKDVSLFPLKFTMSNNQQLQMGADMFRTCKTTLHVDATGSMIKRQKGDHRPLTYSMVPSTSDEIQPGVPIFPISEYASTSHNVPDIQHWMSKFMWYIGQITASKKARPNMIVSDWSYAILHAASQAFNGRRLVDYDRLAYRLVHGQLTSEQVR